VEVLKENEVGGLLRFRFEKSNVVVLDGVVEETDCVEGVKVGGVELETVVVGCCVMVEKLNVGQDFVLFVFGVGVEVEVEVEVLKENEVFGGSVSFRLEKSKPDLDVVEVGVGVGV
jgi:hypothetical protein